MASVLLHFCRYRLFWQLILVVVCFDVILSQRLFGKKPYLKKHVRSTPANHLLLLLSVLSLLVLRSLKYGVRTFVFLKMFSGVRFVVLNIRLGQRLKFLQVTVK